MKYRYYVTDLFEGAIVGTDSTEDAELLAQSEEHFVIDSETGEWLTTKGREQVLPVE